MNLHLALISACVLLFGAFTFSFAGFGFGLVTLPFLMLFLPIRTAVAFQFPFAFALVLYQAWSFRSYYNMEQLWPMLIGACLTMPLGMISLYYFPEGTMKKFLAVFMVLAVAVNCLKGMYIFRRAWAVFFGVISGWFQGAYTIGGPPAVVYIMSSRPSLPQAKGLLGAYFSFLYLVTAGMYGARGIFAVEWLLNSLYLSPAVAAGVLLGTAASKRLIPETYRMVVNGLLLFASVLLWFSR